MLPSPVIARNVLFGNPDRLRPSVSPDGRWIAYLAPHRDRLNIWVGAVTDRAYAPVTGDTGSGVRTYSWAHDGRHLIFLQDRDGDENTRLCAVDLHTREVRVLTPQHGVQARIVAMAAADPSAILVGLNLRDPGLHDVYRLDLGSGELTEVARNTGVTTWTADQRLRVRAAVATRPAAGLAVLVRNDETAPWRTVHEVTHEDSTGMRVLGFTDDDTSLLVLSSKGSDTIRLLRIDVATADTEVVYEDPHHDVVGVGTAPADGRPQFVLVQRERNDVEVLDEDLRDHLDLLRASSRGDVSVLSRDTADQLWVVQYNVDDGPSTFHLYRRPDRRADVLFSHCAALEGKVLATVEPFSCTARDGLRLHGYLTFPPGVERTALPTVVVVHGGPWTRDVWGYRGETQWLANRGYLCVQVNFRGSTGYGKHFVNAGDRQWGAAMHTDLLDAVRHVVASEVADPRRVGIYGGSYGGYAALVGATFTPEVFRCGVAVAAPSDLRSFLRSIPAHWRQVADRLALRIGDPDTEQEFLWSRSPLSRIDRIGIPLLIAHGAKDPRVLPAEAEQVVAALARRGMSHEYLLFPDEGHGFVKPGNRMTFYAAAERFLAEHLGGRQEDDPDDAARG